DLFDVLVSVLGKLADLRQLTSQGSKFSAQDSFPFRYALFRKCQLEIAHAHLPQSHMEHIDKLRQPDTEYAGDRTGQCAQNFDEGPRCRVFQFPSHPEASLYHALSNPRPEYRVPNMLLKQLRIMLFK